MPTPFGTALLVANPVAQNGRSAVAIDRVASRLRGRLPKDALEVALTDHPRHAVELAARAQADVVVALGGDGLVHEVANGLMSRPAAERPALGVVPAGSGNDYARSLGMSSDLAKACDQLLDAAIQPLDVGCVNGEWFVETLSFGVDAAIALETVERRVRTGRTGLLLYAESGLNQLAHHLVARAYTATFDDGEPVSGESITFAVQIGPYYGSGFKVCPDASLDDGLFDVCISHPPVTLPRALWIFMRAKDGKHVGFRQMELRKAAKLRIEFEEQPPAQADGERVEGRAFEVTMAPRALRVLVPAS